MVAFGVVGGLIGFILSKLVNTDSPSVDTEGELRILMGKWFLMILIGIGVFLVIGHSVAQSKPIAGRTLAIAAVALLIGGFLSGYLAQMIFSGMLDDDAINSCSDYSCYANEVRPARAVGWLVAGALGGVAVGAGFMSKRRLQNAIAGGAIGGLIGGLLFDTIPQVVDTENEGVPQAVAIVLIGALMGAAMSLIESARVSMWLEATTGELRGRQYLLLDDRSSVGSARTAHVTIADRAVKEIHLFVDRFDQGANFTCATSDPVYLNGHPLQSGQLRNGDFLRIGNTDLRFVTRQGGALPVAPVAAPPPEPRQRPLARDAAPGGTPSSAPAPTPPPVGSGPMWPPGDGPAAPPPPQSTPPTARPRLPVNRPPR